MNDKAPTTDGVGSLLVAKETVGVAADWARKSTFQAALKVMPKHRQRIVRSKLNPRWYRWAHAANGAHWAEMGERQLKFLIEAGLEPSHQFLDVGCGPLRAGVHLVRYLEVGHYCGMDLDPAFLASARKELEMAGLDHKDPTLLLDDSFRFKRFERRFDFALAQSVFTHVSFNTITRCVSQIEASLKPGGKFFATFTRNPGPRLRHDSFVVGGNLRNCDRDPFYYDADMFRWLVEGSTLDVELIGYWGHPKDQEMLMFTKR